MQTEVSRQKAHNQIPTLLVSERLQKHDITLDVRKYQVRTNSLDFRGHPIDAQVIRSPKSKKAAILNYSKPTTVMHPRTFNRLISLCQWFIPNSKSPARPLTVELRGTAGPINSDDNVRKYSPQSRKLPQNQSCSHARTPKHPLVPQYKHPSL